MSEGQTKLLDLLRAAKALARDYYQLTGRPLGVTGEIAEYEAVRLLDLELAGVRQEGYDAVRYVDGRKHRIQIKGRCIATAKCKPGQRLGRIETTTEWDSVILVLLDKDFNATHIYEADREKVVAALVRPGSKARNINGALSVGTFKSIGRQIWSRPA